MSPSPWSSGFFGAMLWMALGSTLAGCVSAPPSMREATAGHAATAPSTGDTTISGQEDPDVWHLLRSAVVDLYDAGVLFNPFLDGPIRIQLTGGR